MTDMKRITVSLTDEIDEAIQDIRNSNELKRMSYSGVLRKLVEQGIKAYKEASRERDAGAERDGESA